MFRNSLATFFILESRLITHPPHNLSDLVVAYNSTLTSLIDIHAPLKTKTFRAKPINKWYTPALSALNAVRRHLENLWLRTRSPHHLKLLHTASNKYHSAIIAAKKRFSLIASSTSNPCKLRNSINTLLERKPSPLLPSLASSQSLSQMFATFFSDKILKLHTALKSSSTASSPHIPPKNTPIILSSFPLISEDEVSKIISHSTITPAQCARDVGVIFVPTLSMSDHISSVSKSRLLSIRDL